MGLCRNGTLGRIDLPPGGRRRKLFSTALSQCIYLKKDHAMKIGTDNNYPYTSHRARTSAEASATAASFASALTSATAAISTAKPTDFSAMTRQEMFDWMNQQIRSGKMSLDESSPFLAMTVKISAATGQPVDMASDGTRVNFIEKARLGIDGALSRNDADLAKRLQLALDIMHRTQGQTIGVDVRA